MKFLERFMHPRGMVLDGAVTIPVATDGSMLHATHECEPPEKGGSVWTCPECRLIWTRFWEHSNIKLHDRSPA